jgi:hypothetical protein
VERAARHPDVASLATLSRWREALLAGLEQIDHETIEGIAPFEHRFDPSREMLATAPRVERLPDGKWVATTPRGPVAEPSPHFEVATADCLEHDIARDRDPRLEKLRRIEVAGALEVLVQLAARIVRTDSVLAGTFERAHPGRPIPAWLRDPIDRSIEPHRVYARSAGAKALDLLAARLHELATERDEVDAARARIAAAKVKLAEIEQREREVLTAPPTEAELAALADADDEDGVFDLEGA